MRYQKFAATDEHDFAGGFSTAAKVQIYCLSFVVYGFRPDPTMWNV
jgi:hypothetical protein